MEKTYVMVKPHFANYEKVVNEIKKRLLSLGLNMVKEGYIKYDRTYAQKHYEEHIGKSFYAGLETYITSDKAYGMVLEGEDAITKVRSIAGGTIKKDRETGEVLSLPSIGTIRRDIPALLGEECRQTENVLHSSDSKESAKKEIAIFESLLSKNKQKDL
jgi:nucleoside-diphosphate kinase